MGITTRCSISHRSTHIPTHKATHVHLRIRIRRLLVVEAVTLGVVEAPQACRHQIANK